MNPWLCNLLFNNSGGSSLPVTGQTFYASLKNSLVPEVGTGGPTWSRATTAWRFNDIGLLRQIPSGCAEFGGARLVTNLCPTPSNTLAVAGTKTVTLTAAATLQFSMGAGTGTATFSGTGGATGTLAAGASRVSVNKTVTAGTFIVTASVADLVDLSIVDVTGRDASYVPEYVSVGSTVGKNFFLHTDDFSQSAWIKSNVTITQSAIANPVNGLVNAQKVEVTTSTNATFYQDATSSGLSSGNVFVVYVKQGSGVTDANSFIVRNNTSATNLLGISFNYSTGAITYNTGSTGASAVALPNGWWKLQMVVTSGISNGNTMRLYIGYTGLSETAGEHLYVYRPYAGQGTTAPDVIPVVAGAWDAHGTGVDGCKYFATDWQGAPIPVANLTRLRKESSATNVLLWSRDFAGATSTELGNSPTIKAWVPSVTGSNLVTNGTFDTDLTGWTNSGVTATVVNGQMRLDSTSSGGGRYQVVSVTIGKTYLLTADVTFVSGSGSVSILVYTDNSSTTTLKYNLFSASGSANIIFKATSASHRIYISCNGTGRVVDIDNVVLKEVTCVPERTATGLDGIANTATTLTATAADAIILQSTSGIASAARCASAYVERVTGTGTISFTQDGGSTWTDITSQINAATYVRAQITATLANPSVGFKISTAGDAINVDCVQNEAGSVATSPIVTTTATVTRNADALTDQTSGNWSDTAGTAYILAKPVVYSGGAVGSATNGLLLSASNSGATAYDGTNSANGPTGTPGAVEKLALAWGSSTMSVASSGLVGTPGTYDGAMGLSSIGVGVGAVGYFGDVAIYNYKMTDAELQAITT